MVSEFAQWRRLEDARKASKAAAEKVAVAAAAVAMFGPAIGTPSPPSTPSPPPKGRASGATGLTQLARVQLFGKSAAGYLMVLMIVDLFPAHLCLEAEWQPSGFGVWVAEAFYHLFDGEEVSMARLAKLRVTFVHNKETVCFQAQAVLPTTAQYVPTMEAFVNNMVSKELLPSGVSAREAEEAVESVFEQLFG